MQGPALSRVTGTTCPSGRNTCVIPIFLPRIPGLIKSLKKPEHRSPSWLPASGCYLPFPKSLDLDVYPRRQIELHQRIHGVLSRLENIEQTLVRPDLKLLPALLI